MRAQPLKRPLQLFTGKGGVGKTTVVLALALAHAERAGTKPLIVELGHRASIQSAVDVAIGWTPTEIAPNVHATNIVADDAIAFVLARWLRVRTVANRMLRLAAIQAFVRAAPAVVEVATIERILSLAQEGFDPILVDADASGHARMFVSLPSVFASLRAGGPVAVLLDRMKTVFADPSRVAMHLVTLPGALPIHETLELDRALREDGHIAMGTVIVNRMMPKLEVDVERIEALCVHVTGSGERALARDLERWALELREALENRRRVDALRARIAREVYEVGVLPSARPSMTELRALGRVLLGDAS